MTKWVYEFSEGNINMRNLLGEKGTNLAEMTNLGLPVPQGFTITTEACIQYYNDKKRISDEIENQIFESLKKIEKIQGKKFGDVNDPLLVSVRSGARISIPGMMKTITNIGLNEEVVKTLAKKSNNPYYAWNYYKKFIEDYATIVMQLPKEVFKKIDSTVNKDKKNKTDSKLNANDLKEIVNIYKKEYKKQTGCEFPENPKEQVMQVIKVAFELWNNPQAILYRKDNAIPDTWGVAVNIQVMPNTMNCNYSSGKIFTRNPETGEKHLYGKIMTNTKNEINSPITISEIKNKHPKEFQELEKVCQDLERKEKDMQEIEFTAENGKLCILQSKTGKRTFQAALMIACDLEDEGIKIETVQMINQNNKNNLDSSRSKRKESKMPNIQDITNYNYKHVSVIRNPHVSEKELVKADEQIKRLIKRK